MIDPILIFVLIALFYRTLTRLSTYSLTQLPNTQLFTQILCISPTTWVTTSVIPTFSLHIYALAR